MFKECRVLGLGGLRLRGLRWFKGGLRDLVNTECSWGGRVWEARYVWL